MVADIVLLRQVRTCSSFVPLCLCGSQLLVLSYSIEVANLPNESNFDVVIIGGGHNGLVAAAYLARAHKKVCVLERRSVLGGAATTEELWPGYRVSTAAYVISLFLPQIIRDLRLSQYGLKILPRNPSSFTPLPDGRAC